MKLGDVYYIIDLNFVIPIIKVEVVEIYKGRKDVALRPLLKPDKFEFGLNWHQYLRTEDQVYTSLKKAKYALIKELEERKKELLENTSKKVMNIYFKE